MSSIRSIIERGGGRSNGWRVEKRSDGVAHLYHYSTLMLTWNSADPADESVLSWDLGWGSRSDMNGMNVAFRLLDLPYYYTLNRGPAVEALESARG